MNTEYIPIIYYIFTISSFIIYYYNKYNSKYNSYQIIDNNDLDNFEENNTNNKNIINDIELNIPLTQLSTSNKININNNNNNNNNNIEKTDNNLDINTYYCFDLIKKKTMFFI